MRHKAVLVEWASSVGETMNKPNVHPALISLFLLTVIVGGCSRLEELTKNRDQQPEKPVANSTAGPEKSPSFDGYVLDEASVIDATPETEIEAALRQLEERAKVKCIVVTVRSVGGKQIREYAAERLSDMNVRAEKGVILFVTAIEDREWYIKAAPGLDVELSDEDLSQIGEALVPDFKAKRYAAGLKKSIREMVAKLAKSEKFEAFEIE